MSAEWRKKKSLLIDDILPTIQKIAVENPFDTPLQQAITAQTAKAIQEKPTSAEVIKVVKAPTISAPIGLKPQSISISKNKVVEQHYSETVTNVQVSEPINSTKPYSAADFQTAWRKFEATLTEEKLIGYQNLNTPQLIGQNLYEVSVNNVMQDSQAKRLLSEAVQFIRTELNNNAISINTKVLEESEIQRSLSPEQQYMEMVAKNPQLEQFRKILHLEID